MLRLLRFKTLRAIQQFPWVNSGSKASKITGSQLKIDLYILCISMEGNAPLKFLLRGPKIKPCGTTQMTSVWGQWPDKDGDFLRSRSQAMTRSPTSGRMPWPTASHGFFFHQLKGHLWLQGGRGAVEGQVRHVQPPLPQHAENILEIIRAQLWCCQGEISAFYHLPIVAAEDERGRNHVRIPGKKTKTKKTRPRNTRGRRGDRSATKSSAQPKFKKKKRITV